MQLGLAARQLRQPSSRGIFAVLMEVFRDDNAAWGESTYGARGVLADLDVAKQDRSHFATPTSYSLSFAATMVSLFRGDAFHEVVDRYSRWRLV